MNRRRFLQALGAATATPVVLAPTLSHAEKVKAEVTKRLVKPQEIFDNPLTALVIEPTCDINAMALRLSIQAYETERFPIVPKLKAWLTYTDRCDHSTALTGARTFIDVVTLNRHNGWQVSVQEDERVEVLGSEEFIKVMDRWEDTISIRSWKVT